MTNSELRAEGRHLRDGRNLLIILSDEHNLRVLDAYGAHLAHTPNLDALAAAGMVFDTAYCNSPLCVPSRASLMTGRHLHQTGHWDNAHPYDGQPESWAHRLVAAGHRCASVGKLHFRREGAQNGFDEQILPLHVPGGEGDIQGLIRRPQPITRHPDSARHLAADAGPGHTPYQDYDRAIAAAAAQWLETAGKAEGRPWCLFVSFVCPHFPLVAPPEHFARFADTDLPLPTLRGPGKGPGHPVLDRMRAAQYYDAWFADDTDVLRALRAYWGLVSILDENVGLVLGALERSGQSGDTVVLYSSDHGDNLGARHLWSKLMLHEDSAAVPMILRGPGIGAGQRLRTPVSLVDVFPTVVETVTAVPAPDDLPGRALTAIAADEAAAGAPADRTVLCQYHGPGSVTGCFMLRFGRWKYIHDEGFAPQLFDLERDPEEARDLAGDPAAAGVLAEADIRLRRLCDPTTVTERAFADQARLIARHGGEAAVRARAGFPYTPAPGERLRAT